MNSCLKANLLTAVSMALIVHGMTGLQINDIKAQVIQQGNALQSRSIDDKKALEKALDSALEAKRAELIATEAARVAEKELVEVKKKLSLCVKQ